MQQSRQIFVSRTNVEACKCNHKNCSSGKVDPGKIYNRQSPSLLDNYVSWGGQLWRDCRRMLYRDGQRLLLVPRNSSRGRGVIPSLAELGEQSYQLTSAWVLPVWNEASWSVVTVVTQLLCFVLWRVFHALYILQLWYGIMLAGNAIS
jgi:hypothetical protein